MFYFITTLRHPSNAKNYDAVMSFLRLTIESVCNQQTSMPYKFLIVCNKKPKLQINNSIVDFLEVDFPSPGHGKGKKLSFESVLIDKGSKLAAGLAYIYQFSPSKVFIIDSDDWIDRGVVEFVSARPDIDFWHVESGHLVNFNSKTVTRKHGLCRYCGSAFIYDYKKLLEIIKYRGVFGGNLTQEYMVEHTDDFGMRYILGDHRRQLGYLHKLGLKMKPLPMRTICWVLDTGENHSGKTGGEQGVPISKKLLERYGVSSIPCVERKATLRELVHELFATIMSYLGWITTDKKAQKV